jgi:hypothetical protein
VSQLYPVGDTVLACPPAPELEIYPVCTIVPAADIAVAETSISTFASDATAAHEAPVRVGFLIRAIS